MPFIKNPVHNSVNMEDIHGVHPEYLNPRRPYLSPPISIHAEALSILWKRNFHPH